MLECMIPVFWLYVIILLTVLALIKYYDEGIEILCADNFKQRCYPILARVMVDYEEQVLITKIKSNIQCFKYQVLSKKQENLAKLKELQMYPSI